MSTAKSLIDFIHEKRPQSTQSYLSFENNKNEFRILETLLKENQILSSLSLNLKDEKSQRLIANVMRENKFLKNLTISFISDQGAILIAEALKENSTLEKLALEYGRIKNDGFKAISNLFTVNNTITSIDIYKNYDSINTDSLAESLTLNTTLLSLNLSFCKIDNSSIIALAKALLKNSTLKNINLEYNDISPHGILAFFETLKVNFTLENVNLFSNHFHFNEEIDREAIKTMKQNFSVQKLKFYPYKRNYQFEKLSERNVMLDKIFKTKSKMLCTVFNYPRIFRVIFHNEVYF